MLGATCARVLHAKRDAAVSQTPQTLDRHRRPETVAAQSLAPHVIARGDVHAGVEIEALVVMVAASFAVVEARSVVSWSRSLLSAVQSVSSFLDASFPLADSGSVPTAALQAFHAPDRSRADSAAKHLS